MKIEYKILWIEDSKEWFDSVIDNVDSYLTERGFTLDYELMPKYEEGLDFSQFDIIVVDYNLSDDEKGSDAINVIRNDKEIYTEILFYSYSGEDELRRQMAEKFIDGIYCADRTTCIEKLERLIDITIRKTQEINNLRGLVMAETSETDQLIRDILLKVKWSDENIAERHSELHGYHDEKKKALKKDPPLPKDMVPFIHEHFQSTFSFQTLSKFVAASSWEKIMNYKDEVIEKRNFLAHGVELKSSSREITIVKTRGDGSTVSMKFTPDDFVELRKRIKNFKKEFEKLSS